MSNGQVSTTDLMVIIGEQQVQCRILQEQVNQAIARSQELELKPEPEPVNKVDKATKPVETK